MIGNNSHILQCKAAGFNIVFKKQFCYNVVNVLTSKRGPQERLVVPIGSPSKNKEFTYLLTY